MRLQLSQQARESLGTVHWLSSQSGSTMWRSSLVRWSRWACWRYWIGISHAIGRNGSFKKAVDTAFHSLIAKPIRHKATASCATKTKAACC